MISSSSEYSYQSEKIKEIWSEVRKNNIEYIRRLDEDVIFDRKRGFTRAETVEKLMVAITNTYGGIIAFGIDNDKNLTEVTRFARDIVVHDSQVDDSLVGSWFPEVSEAFSDCLKYGNQTEVLAYDIFHNVYCYWLPYWDDTSSRNELTDVNTIVQWCIDEIDYEYDTNITLGQEPFTQDYFKFPVETAFRTMDDYEDQAMLTAAYLESMGYETALGVFHDVENSEYINGFYHGTLLVHISDIESYNSLYPLYPLWSLEGYDPYEGYTWCLLDTTQDVPFGSIPEWLQYYLDNGLTFEDVTFAICDLDGAISL